MVWWCGDVCDVVEVLRGGRGGRVEGRGGGRRGDVVKERRKLPGDVAVGFAPGAAGAVGSGGDTPTVCSGAAG